MKTTKNSRVARRSPRREIPLIIFGAGLVLVVILLVSFFPMTRHAKDDAYIQQMEARLSALENRLSELLPVIERSAGEERPDSRFEKLNTTCQRLEASLTLKSNLLAVRLDKLEARVQEIADRKVPSLPEEQVIKPVQVKKKTVAKAVKQPAKKSRKVHVVEKGDTAYSISKRYGISLKKLKELNGFTEKTIIYPGQKLVVAP